MIRYLAGLLVLALAGMPLLSAPSGLIALFGAAAGALGTAGIIGLSVPWMTAGGAVALIEYALALWLSAAPPDFLTAVALGVVLSLLLDVVDFDRRLRGAAVERRVVLRQVRYWLGAAAINGGAGLTLAVAGPQLTLGLPAWGHSVVAAAGAVAVFVGALRALWPPREVGEPG